MCFPAGQRLSLLYRPATTGFRYVATRGRASREARANHRTSSGPALTLARQPVSAPCVGNGRAERRCQVRQLSAGAGPGYPTRRLGREVGFGGRARRSGPEVGLGSRAPRSGSEVGPGGRVRRSGPEVGLGSRARKSGPEVESGGRVRRLGSEVGSGGPVRLSGPTGGPDAGFRITGLRAAPPRTRGWSSAGSLPGSRARRSRGPAG